MKESEEVIKMYPELEGAEIIAFKRLPIADNWVLCGNIAKEIPDTRNKYFSKGKMFNYFESLTDFVESNVNSCVIPLYCIQRKNNGKRYFINVIDSDHNTAKIFNVEIIGGNWINNEHNKRNIRSPLQGIEICYPGECFLFLLIKEPDSVYGFRVSSVKN